MGERHLKLLGTKESLFTYRVIWVLKLKGIQYEFIEEDLSNKSSLLLKLNPIYKKVPVLIHGDNSLSESQVILEYIDETWPAKSILPKDPSEKAYARFWAKFIDEKFYKAATTAFFSPGEERAKGIEATTEALQLLEKEISGKQFFAGEAMGYLDLVAGWIAYWFPFVEEVGEFKVMDSKTYPSLDSWVKNFLNVPVIKENLPPPDALRAVFQGFKNMAIAAANAKV